MTDLRSTSPNDPPELPTLHEIGVVLSSTLDLDELLDKTLLAVTTHLSCDRAMILLVEKRTAELAEATHPAEEAAGAIAQVDREKGALLAEARESQRRLTDIINFLPDATLVIDAEGRVIAWNRAMEEMMNITPGEMLEKAGLVVSIASNGNEAVEKVKAETYDAVLMGTLKDPYAIVAAISGEKALKMALAGPQPDIILLDIMMPGMDGFEVCRRLKADTATRDIPVIFLSALDDTGNKVKGFSVGAVDYISKPFQPEEVHVRVNTHLTMNFLKQNLAEKNKELQAYSEGLEEKVKERTAELASLNRIYERFVPREFIDLLQKKSILEIHLGDQVSHKMTVMFADIRGWTTLLEKMTPQQAFNFINAYLRRVSPVIKECNGFIDQYYGDGVMALFPGPPDDAVKAAVSMQSAVADYNKERARDGYDPIGIGVGLHRADLMLGIIGSEDRMQGSVVADAVNLAARIEGLNKRYGSYVSLSDESLFAMKDPNRYRHRFIDKVRVKGREDAVTVYEVFEGDPAAVAALKEQTKPSFESGLQRYYAKKFSEASVYFNRVLEKNAADLAARIYLKRCADYMVNGVPPEWTGVETLLEK